MKKKILLSTLVFACIAIIGGFFVTDAVFSALPSGKKTDYIDRRIKSFNRPDAISFDVQKQTIDHGEVYVEAESRSNDDRIFLTVRGTTSTGLPIVYPLSYTLDLCPARPPEITADLRAYAELITRLTRIPFSEAKLKQLVKEAALYGKSELVFGFNWKINVYGHSGRIEVRSLA